MPKTIAYAGALATALLVASAGTAAAQSTDGMSSDAAGDSSLSELMATEGGYLGELGEVAPGSLTGSLPGYASGSLGSTTTAACNAGTVAGWVAQATGVPLPLPVPVGVVCAVVNPLAQSADHLVAGDIDGSVGAIIGGVPLIGNSLADRVNTDSATESVEGVVGDRLGSVTETSLAPGN